jgi:hypothetical protein
MTDQTLEPRLVANRVLLVPGVRKGILRKPGSLVITRMRLVFVPEGGGGDEALQRLDGVPVDEITGVLKEMLAACSSEDEAMSVPRNMAGLAPPDDDGRLRLLPLGEEDDLLVPTASQPLVALTMGPPQPQRGAPARSMAPVSAAMAPAQSGVPAAPVGERPGWLGPINGGVGALLALLVLPLLVLFCVLMAEEVDDELGAVVFLLGSGTLGLAHLATFVGAGFGFARREFTRFWGLSTVAFAGLTGLICMAGCLVALEELF